MLMLRKDCATITNLNLKPSIWPVRYSFDESGKMILLQLTLVRLVGSELGVMQLFVREQTIAHTHLEMRLGESLGSFLVDGKPQENS
jgi:hypothetical protein